MSEWIDFSPQPIDFAERTRGATFGPLTPLLGVLGAILAVCVALVLG